MRQLHVGERRPGKRSGVRLAGQPTEAPVVTAWVYGTNLPRAALCTHGQGCGQLSGVRCTVSRPSTPSGGRTEHQIPSGSALSPPARH